MQSSTIQHVTFAGWRCRYGARKSGLPTIVQAQVAAGLAAGLTQKEIAKLRGVSPASVRTVAEALYWQLGAYRATAAVAEAMRRGWIAPVVLALLISGINPDAEGMRHRAPARTQTRVSTSRTVSRRDVGSVYA
ncbi:response regulator transcription factor [Halomonas citrativorans]|uniref:response regulator transcription factor n=1 Tax=Halomonas citrativorans TaxID=2742612 RepID=UPI000B356C1C|nr:response regulator transcription factor [Halomonas citrativorans]